MFVSCKLFALLLMTINLSLPVRSDICDKNTEVLECARTYGGGGFVDLIHQTGTEKYFKATPEKTLFLPSNAAVDEATKAGVIAALQSSGRLADAVRHHLVDRKVSIANVSNDAVMTSDSGYQLRVNVYKTTNCRYNITVSGASVILNPSTPEGGKYNLVIINRFLDQLPDSSIYDFIIKSDKYSTFDLAASKANILDILKGGPYTVFVPNNLAFSKLPPGIFSNLLNDVPSLTKVVLGHVVKSSVYSQGGLCISGFNTMANTTLSLTSDINSNAVNVRSGNKEIQISAANISMTNGVIYEINDVILPTEFL